MKVSIENIIKVDSHLTEALSYLKGVIKNRDEMDPSAQLLALKRVEMHLGKVQSFISLLKGVEVKIS